MTSDETRPRTLSLSFSPGHALQSVTWLGVSRYVIVTSCMRVFEGREQVHTFVFRLTNDSACRHLWQCAVDHHIFFRLCHDALQTQTPGRSTSSSIFRRSRRSIQRHDSSFTAASFVRRRDVHIDRRPSQKFPARRSTVSTAKHRDHSTAVASSCSTADVGATHRSVQARRCRCENCTYIVNSYCVLLCRI